MIIIKTNIGQIIELTVAKLQSLSDTDKMLRTCATTALAMMKTRIHEKGLAADNTAIGKYSKGYMVLRTGAFQNAARVSRGENKGKLKNAGVFTDRTITLNRRVGVFSGDDKVGKARPRYNRTSDDTVVASLTRQMENDEKVIGLSGGGYGIGFLNPLNFQKSQWVEATYKKPGKIFAVSADEQQAVIAIAEKHTKDALSR